ncbi:MAG TPA: hypothetical protein VGQ62_11435 [Chloroflexota bacterium]|jgi:hypothetical protein|nr:hypothetical protein [Chloroflexota bacterium]
MSIRSLFRGRRRALGLAVVMLLATVVAPLSASAYYMGWPNGHWPYSGGGLHVHYSRGCAGTFYGAAGDAASGWTATPTPIWYDEVGSPPCNGGVYNGYVDIYSTYQPSVSWWGWAQAYTLHTVCDFWFFGCLSSHQVLDPSWNETYAAGQIMLNTAKANSGNYFLQVGDVTHEMGHILGLAHAGAYCGCGDPNSYYSIMDYLNWSYNRPRTYDINTINYLY